MKNLKVSNSKHERIKNYAATEGVSITLFADAVFEDALTRLERGEASLTQPSLQTEGRPVSHTSADEEKEGGQ